MRFNSLEDLVRYIVTNNVNVPDVEVNVGTVDDNSPVNDVTPDVVAEPETADGAVVEPQGKVVESIKVNLASGKIECELESGALMVESVAYNKNSCGTGSFVINGITVCANMCEMDGDAVAYLNVGDGVIQPVKIRAKK